VTLAAGPTPRAPAELDRRFYAFTLDRLVAWTVDALAAYAAYLLLIDQAQVVAGVVVVLGVVLLVGVVLALVLGRTGSSPGNAALGLRTVDQTTGRPIGVRRALLRQLVLGLATLPTFGIGLATLAWTAVSDPTGRRRGWHDSVAGSEVVDVRPVPEDPVAAEPGPRHVVNLTALRLVPAAPAAPPGDVSGPVHHARPDAQQQRPQLGHPLVPEPAAVRWRLAFDTGESVAVEGTVLVGRRPEPRPGEEVRHLVPLGSADMSLSKTHVQVEPVADGGLVVTDRGSTNGSILIRQGAARQLAPGRPTTLLDGDVVRVGDRDMMVARGR
jgi:hypothetical protein